ncbi:MAG: hypothetical protein KDA79_01215 [Planctomycetaceae bacterium]|nr:hypothetical protein [Planctomycetaceae bacterium]
MFFNRRKRFTCLALGWAVTLQTAGAAMADDAATEAAPFRPLFAEPLQLDSSSDSTSRTGSSDFERSTEEPEFETQTGTRNVSVDDEFFPARKSDAGETFPRIDVGQVPKITTPEPATRLVSPEPAEPSRAAAFPVLEAQPAQVTRVTAAQPEAIPQPEVIRERYDNRRIRIERQVIRDENLNYKNHGEWTMWSPDGQKIAWGNYWKGLRQGRWIRWHVKIEGDRLTAATATTGDQADIDESLKFEQPLRSEALFIEGKLTGSWIVSDAKGRKVSSWEFHADQLNGTAIWWYPNGQKQREISYSDGELDGVWKEWSPEGELTLDDVYVAGRRKAVFTKLFDNGEKSVEGSYLYPTNRMVASPDWWDGRLEFKVVKQAGDKLRTGKWTYWYTNGGRQTEGEYVENQPVGTHRWWYPNGQLKVEGTYVNGKKQGQWLWYHKNGQKMMEGGYIDGEAFGSWVTWDEVGKVAGMKNETGRSGSTPATTTAGKPIQRATRPQTVQPRFSQRPARAVRQR